MIDETWLNVKRFWNDPNLPDPSIYKTKEEGDKVIGDEIAAFEYVGRKTHIHLPNLEERLGKEFLEPVEKHEVGHDRFCPYDLKTCLLLVDAADEVLGDLKQAKYAENLLSDIFVNTHTTNKGDHGIISVYSKLSENKSDDPVWNFYLATYEKLWGLRENTLAKFSTPEIIQEAEEMAEEVRKTMYDSKQWTKTMQEFSKVIKRLNQEKPKNRTPEKSYSPPLIDSHSPKDMVPYEIDEKDLRSIKQLKKDLKGISKDISFSRYKRVVEGTSVCKVDLAVKMFYIDKALQYEIPPPMVMGIGGSVTPSYRKEWLPEDPVETLDIAHSLEQTGRVIPEENTYKWHHEAGSGGELDRTYSDILLVHDSSGSMPDPTQMVSVPCLSSIILAHSAINNDKQVAVINFSADYFLQEYTANRYEADEAILKYLGDNTNIPGQEILSLVESNPNPQHVLLSTDTRIDNIESQLPFLEQAINKAGSGSIFLFGKKGGSTQSLENIGFKVYRATSMEDLLALSTDLSQQLYG